LLSKFAAADSTPASAGDYQLSVDTGGTFTDGFVRGRNRSAQVKVDTTPADVTEGFVACVAAAAEAMDESLQGFLARASLVHFSSTIATNIVLQRTGALVGLIVTAGNEKSLYAGEHDAAPLLGFIGSEAVRGVDEATGPDGAVLRPVDGTGLEEATRELLALGVHIVVVSFAGAHLNPANEVAAKALIEASYPRHYLGSVPLVLSSQLSLHADDHGRTALAIANAYLHPALARSLYRAADQLRDQQLRYPLLVVNTDGSSTRVAKTRAIDTFNSGPSAGVLGSAAVASALSADHVVTFDVGGTTTDVAHLRGASPSRTDWTAFGELAVPHPAIDLSSFGLGGGSIIELAADGSLDVGPISAGAVPGPACFGLGGDRLTPTDVWLHLGYLQSGEFLSGRRQLDPERARTALASVGERLGVGTDAAALAALDAIHAALADHLLAWSARQAELRASSPDDRWLFSYGGGGGLLAVPAAAALGIGRVVIFPQSSTFSAFGGGLLPIAHAYHAAVGDVSDPQSVNGALEVMLDRAARDMRAEGVPAGTELTADVSLRDFDGRRSSSAGPLRRLAAGHLADGVLLPEPGRTGELIVRVGAPREPDLRVVLAAANGTRADTRRILSSDGVQDVPVSPGLGDPLAGRVAGPTFLSAQDTTVFIPAGWEVEFDSLGYGIVQKEG